MIRGLAAAALFAALMIAPACNKHASARHRPGDAGPAVRRAKRAYRILLTGVTPKVVATDHRKDIDPAALAAALRAQLIASPQFFARAGDVPAGFRARRARVELTVDWDLLRGHHPSLSAVAAVKTHVSFAHPGGDLDLGENVIARRPLPAENKKLDALLAAHIARAIETAGNGLIAKEALREGPAKAVVSALGGSDSDLVKWALAIVGERRLAVARAAVEHLLQTGDPEIRAAAVDALVAIGDPRSVPALTNMAKFSDPAAMRMVIKAVAAIGGDDASSYLAFVASGHPDPGIRRRAAEGLAQLRRRAPARKRAPAGRH